MKFIGLDAHSKTCFFVVLSKTGRVTERRRVTTNEGEILRFVRAVNGPKKLAFEEGVLSHWLYLLLKDEVDELVVCQPMEHDGPKNDERDAGEQYVACTLFEQLDLLEEQRRGYPDGLSRTRSG